MHLFVNIGTTCFIAIHDVLSTSASPRETKRAPKGDPKNDLFFYTIFGRKNFKNGPQKGSKNRSKFDQKSTLCQDGLQRGSKGPQGVHFEPLWPKNLVKTRCFCTRPCNTLVKYAVLRPLSLRGQKTRKNTMLLHALMQKPSQNTLSVALRPLNPQNIAKCNVSNISNQSQSICKEPRTSTALSQIRNNNPRCGDLALASSIK